LRRIPGQSVNLAHLIWRTPRAPAPLYGHPRRVFRGGAMGVGGGGAREPRAARLTDARLLAQKKRPHPVRMRPFEAASWGEETPISVRDAKLSSVRSGGSLPLLSRDATAE
jgi:hypothetical protein